MVKKSFQVQISETFSVFQWNFISSGSIMTHGPWENFLQSKNQAEKKKERMIRGQKVKSSYSFSPKKKKAHPKIFFQFRTIFSINKNPWGYFLPFFSSSMRKINKKRTLTQFFFLFFPWPSTFLGINMIGRISDFLLSTF